MNIFPENISTYGQQIDDLFYLICIISGLAFIITLIVMFYPLFKYRGKKGAKAKYIKGSNTKQLKWIIISMSILAIADFYILFVEHSTWAEIEETLPDKENAFKVGISGRQWSWTITYPGPDGKLYTGDDVIATNDLHVPINTIVHIDIMAFDVVHSVFFPNIRLKQDALPGRTITRWFEVTKEGRYDISCAEICGILHSKMKGTLIVDSKEKHKEFLNELYKQNINR